MKKTAFFSVHSILLKSQKLKTKKDEIPVFGHFHNEKPLGFKKKHQNTS